MESNFSCPSIGHMDEHNRKNNLPFSPEDINWVPSNNAYGLHGGHYGNQHSLNPGSNGIYHQESGFVPQWMHCQQTPQNYVEFLAESRYPEFQKEFLYEISTQAPKLGLADSSQLEEHPGLPNVGNFITTSTGLEHQYNIQRQNSIEEHTHAFQAHSGPGSAVPKSAYEARRRKRKEKSYAADRCRRQKISYWLDALRELVPHPEEVGKGSLPDAVIDHVKNLQNQVKDLCRSRLGGESNSHPLIFLEGHGHYLVQEHMLNGPLEQIMGNMFDAYPSATTELLQSRGLKVMPMTLAGELMNLQGALYQVLKFDHLTYILWFLELINGSDFRKKAGTLDVILVIRLSDDTTSLLS